MCFDLTKIFCPQHL